MRNKRGEFFPEISRKTFLGGAVSSTFVCLLFGTGCARTTYTNISDQRDNSPALISAQYGFWMDSEACVGCGACVEACKHASGTPDGTDLRRRLDRYSFEDGKERMVSSSCMHCSRPACIQVCPAGAISKRNDDGIVVVDKDKCIGCRYCNQACPFAIPHYLSEGMDKCDCCLDAGVNVGDTPYCVQACMPGALQYGTLEYLSKVSAGRARLLEAPTKPSYYLS